MSSLRPDNGMSLAEAYLRQNMPSGFDVSDDEDIAIRTVIGEANGQGSRGMQAVAGVIRNRANAAKKSYRDIVLEPNQFEPWSSRANELNRIDRNSGIYQRTAKDVLPVLRGEAPDPTNGATHFYAPKAQAQLGRRPPSWDNGTGFDIGDHRFFKLGYGGSGKHGILKATKPLTLAEQYLQQAPTVPKVGASPMSLAEAYLQQESPGTVSTQTQQFATPQTVTEPDETINAQITSASDPKVKTRAAVLTTTPQQNALFGNRSDFSMHTLPNDGRTLWVNKAKANRLKLRSYADIDKFIANNPDALTRLIGVVENVGNDTTGVAVTATNPVTGVEQASAIVTSPETAATQLAAYDDQFPDAKKEITSSDDVALRRSQPVEGFAEEVIAPDAEPYDIPTSPVQPISPDSDLARQLGMASTLKAAVQPPVKPQRGITTPKQTPVFDERSFQEANKYLASQGQPTLTREQFAATQVGSGRVDVSAHPSEFTIDGQKITDFDREEQSVGGGTLQIPQQLGKAGANDGIAGIYRPTDTMSAEEAARNAYLAAGSRYEATTENWERYKATPAGQRFLAEYPVNDGSRIQVTYKALESGGVDVATQRRMEEAQSRTGIITPKDIEPVPFDFAQSTVDDINDEYGEYAGAAAGGFGRALGGLQGTLGGIFSFIDDLNPAKGRSIPESLGKEVQSVGTDLIDTMRQTHQDYSRFGALSGVKNTDGSETIPSQVIKIAAGLPIDVPKYVAMSMLPGGIVSAMSLDHASIARIQNRSRGEIFKEAVKGGALGSLFRFASSVGKGADTVIATARNKASSDAVKLGAETAFIGGGSYGIERVAGHTPEEALKSALTNAAFHLSGQGKRLGAVLGSVFRIRDQNGNTVTARFTTDGPKQLRGEVKSPDVELYVEMVKGPDGVYYAKGDNSVSHNGNRGNRIGGAEPNALTAGKVRGNPIENPNPSGDIIPLRESGTEARRMPTPDPQAVARLDDKRVRKVIEALRDKDFTTIADLAKATRLDPVNVGDAAMTLYGAGIAELMPGNRIRLIDSPETAKATDIFEKAATYGQTPTVPNVSTKGKNIDTKSTSVDSGNTNQGVKADVELEMRDTAWTPPKEYGESPATQASQIRTLGKQTVDGVEYVRQEVVESPKGSTGKVRFADAEPDPTFTYKLIEADRLQPADLGGNVNYRHFLQEAQPKDRSTAASKNASDKIAQSPDLEQVAGSPNAYSGAPIINARGEVIQGNNRSEGLKKHYGIGGTTYKDDLAKNADRFGFTAEQVNGLKQPVLVRQIDADDDTAIRLGQYKFSDLESGGSVRIDPATTAARIPHNEKFRMLEDVFRDAPDDITLTDLIRKNRSLIKVHLDPFLTDTQKETLDNANKEFTPDAVKDIKSVFKHFLFYKGDPDLPDLFEGLPHNAKEALTASLPKIFSVEQDSSLVPEIQNAILAATDFKNSGVGDYETWKRQPDMVSNTPAPMEFYTPAELALANKLLTATTQKEVKDIFSGYAKIINGSPADLFDEAREPQSKATAISETFGVPYAERKNASAEDNRRETAVDETARDIAAEPATEQRTADTARDAQQADRLDRKLEDLSQLERSSLRRDIAPTANQGRGKLASEAARAYGLPQSELAKLPPLPEVGQFGQTSHIIKSALSSEDNDALYNDFARVFASNELRDIEPEFPEMLDRGSQATNIVDAIALDMDFGRSSQMDADAWSQFLEKHETKLSDDAINLILSALDHQQNWHRTAVKFVQDGGLNEPNRQVFELGQRFGWEALANAKWGKVNDGSKPDRDTFDPTKPFVDFANETKIKKPITALWKQYYDIKTIGAGGLSDEWYKRIYLQGVRRTAQEELAKTTRDSSQQAANRPNTPKSETASGRGQQEELGTVNMYATPADPQGWAELRRNALIEEYGLDPIRDKEIIDALEKSGDVRFNSNAFDQVNLFGEKVTPTTEQPSLFAGLNARTMQAAMDDARRTDAAKVFGKENTDFLYRIFDNPDSVAPRVYRAAVKVSDGQFLVAAKGLQDIADDAVAALDTVNYANSIDTPVDEILPQQDFGGKTISDRLSPRAVEFAKSIERGDFAIVFSKALNDAPSENVRFNSNADLESVTQQPTSAQDRAKESKIAKQLAAPVRNAPEAVNIRTAKYKVDENGVLRATNMAALNTVSKALDSFYGQTPNFTGFHLDKGQTFLFRRAFENARVAALQAKQNNVADALGKTIAYIDQATDPTHGDLTFAIDIPQLPLMSKTSLQEELGHRANYQTKARDVFANIADTPALQKGIANLSSTYANMSQTGKVDEVIAKSFRDDAETELGLTKQEVRANRKALFDGLKNAGISPTAYAEQIANVSRKGAAFAKYARSTDKRNERNRDDEPAGTQKERDPLFSVQQARRQGAGDSRGLDRENPDRFAELRRTDLYGANRQSNGVTALALRTPAEIAFAAPTDAELGDIEGKTKTALQKVTSLIYDGKTDVSAYDAVSNLIRTGYLLGFSVVKTNLVGNTASIVSEQSAKPFMAFADILNAKYNPKAKGMRFVPGLSPGDVLAGILGETGALRDGIFGKRGIIHGMWHGVGDIEASRVDMDTEQAPENPNFVRNTGVPLLDLIIEATKRLVVTVDRPFKAYARTAEERGLSRIAAKNLIKEKADRKGLSRLLDQRWRKVAADIRKDPSILIKDLAERYAETVTFQSPNAISDTYQRAMSAITDEKALRKLLPESANERIVKHLGGATKVGVTSFAPFVKTPTNIGIRTLEYFAPTGVAMAAQKFAGIGEGIERQRWMDDTASARAAQFREIVAKRGKQDIAFKAESQRILDGFKRRKAAKAKEVEDHIDAIKRSTVLTDAAKKSEIAKVKESHTKWLETWKTKRTRYEEMRKDEYEVIDNRRRAADMKTRDEWEAEDLYADQKFDAFDHRKFAEAAGRTSFGAVVGGLFLIGVIRGMIDAVGTTDYEDDKAKWYAKRAAGIPDASIKIGNYRFQYNKSPFGNTINMGLNIVEQMDRPGSKTAKAGQLTKTVGSDMLNLNPITNTQFSKDDFNSLLGSKLNSVTPIVNIKAMQEVAEVIDEKPRKYWEEGLAAQYLIKIPVLRENLPESKTPLGGPDERGDMTRRFLRMIDPLGTVKEKRSQRTLPVTPLKK